MRCAGGVLARSRARPAAVDVIEPRSAPSLAPGGALLANDQCQFLQSRGHRLGLQAVVAVRGERGTLHDRLCGGCRVDTIEVGEVRRDRGAFARGANQCCRSIAQTRSRQSLVADPDRDLRRARGRRHDQCLSGLAFEARRGQRSTVEADAARHGSLDAHRYTYRLDGLRTTAGNVHCDGHERHSGGTIATTANTLSLLRLRNFSSAGGVRIGMKRHWKKIAIAIGALVVLVVGGSFIYAKVINKADPEFGQSDVDAKLDAATTTIGSSSTATVGTSTTVAPVASTPAATAPQSSAGSWQLPA